MKTGQFTNGNLRLIIAGLLLATSAVAPRLFAEETEPVLPISQPAVAPDQTATPAPALPPQIKLSQGAAGIAKLAQGGVDEQVMLAYIGTVNGKFGLGSDQIVYLNDLGVSGAVVKAMIQRDATLDANAATAATTPPPAPPIPAPPIPDDTSVPPLQPPMVDDATANPPVDYGTADDSDYFYNSLSPYGAWVIIPGYGLCWQPTVGLGNRGWQPYADRGRWLYSDCGWYWQSDYSWGWAAFHYGRWFNDAHSGWVWQPNRTWGPAWVSWRHSDDYCGWAPLPPSAKFVSGIGLVYGNRRVGAGFDFGLKANQYKFIPVARLTDYAPARYAADRSQTKDLYGRSAVINQITQKNNRVVNAGINPQEVANASSTIVRRAQIVETSVGANNAVQSEHLTKQGDSLVIVRPQLPAPSHRTINSSAPARSQRSATPLYFKGSSTTTPSEIYPHGSLVVVGPKNVSHSSGASAYPVAYYASANTPTFTSPARSVTTFNFKPIVSDSNPRENDSMEAHSGPIVIPGRYSVSQHIAAHSEFSHAANQTETSNQKFHSEAPAESAVHVTRVESHAATQSFQSSGASSVSHSSSSSSSSSSGSSSSSSGHR